METLQQYDYILLGAGCASLSIVMRMIESQKFTDKKILLIDKDHKNTNDRTWCFWESNQNYFEKIIYKSWHHLVFKDEAKEITLNIAPYKYKMIRGVDFYEHCFKKIKTVPNIDFIKGNIELRTNSSVSNIFVNGKELQTSNATIFNSLYQKEEQKNKHYLLQHFKGLTIETSTNIFSESKATLMDFSIDQSKGTAFMYVLPFSKNKALIEYTLFTKNLLQPKEYDDALKNYITKISNGSYKIIEEEFGVIPMTNANFKFYKNGIYNIGTAGGQTKASTGYTFKFIQQQADKIVEQLIKKQSLSTSGTPLKYKFYDSTFLHVLAEKKVEGKKIFSTLFKENKASAVFKFLDNETTLSEELKIISSLPTTKFLSAGIKELLKML